MREKKKKENEEGRGKGKEKRSPCVLHDNVMGLKQH